MHTMPMRSVARRLAERVAGHKHRAWTHQQLANKATRSGSLDAAEAQQRHADNSRAAYEEVEFIVRSMAGSFVDFGDIYDEEYEAIRAEYAEEG